MSLFLLFLLPVCPGDARFSFGSRRHTPRECWSRKGTGPTSTAEKNKEEKGVQVASAKGLTQQAVGHCRCPQQLFLLQPERNSVSPSLFVAASSGFQSMHSSNPKVRNSPSGNTQRWGLGPGPAAPSGCHSEPWMLTGGTTCWIRSEWGKKKR